VRSDRGPLLRTAPHQYGQRSPSGTLYPPEAHVAFDGNSQSTVLEAQIICETFDAKGNGNLVVTYDPDDGL
jgi:hypothetical protein